MKGPVLEKETGWIPSSRMTRVYVYLSDEGADRAILEAQGVKLERKQDLSERPGSVSTVNHLILQLRSIVYSAVGLWITMKRSY
jgi:hypothetical protein